MIHIQRMMGEWLDALHPGSTVQTTSRGSITEAFVNWLTHFSHYKFAGSCYWCLTGRYHTLIIAQWKMQTAMISHCYAFQVRLHMNCNLWKNMSLDHWNITGTNRFGCFIAMSQIAWDKAAKPDNIKAGSHATGIYSFSHSWWQICSQSCNTKWGCSSLPPCDSVWDASSCFSVTEENSQGFSSAWYI